MFRFLFVLAPKVPSDFCIWEVLGWFPRVGVGIVAIPTYEERSAVRIMIDDPLDNVVVQVLLLAVSSCRRRLRADNVTGAYA